MKQREVLLMDNIYLNYGKIQALNNFSFSLQAGKVHALIGEHGAGKSSIANIINGFQKPKNGKITINGKTYSNLTPRQVKNLSIGMVHQEFTSNPYFTIAENLFYANKKIPFFSWYLNNKMVHASEKFIDKYNISLDVKQLTTHLNLSDRTILEILSTLLFNPSILVLDESLDKLSASSLSKFLIILKELKERGTAILIITHNIDQVYEVADRITIIRSGVNIFTNDIERVDKIQLIKMAYTQMSDSDNKLEVFSSFYQLIKYNEAILTNLPVNLIIFDKYNAIKILNNFCIKNYSINTEEYYGKNIREIFKGTNAKNLEYIISTIKDYEENQLYQIELFINGFKGVFNIRLFHVQEGGAKIGTILLLEDITEYNELQKKNILSEKLSSVGLLAAGVAHEINNPLSIIYNYLTNIQFKFGSEELNSIVKKLQKEVDYITQIVSNLQNFSDNQKVIKEETDANWVIKELINLLLPNAKKKNITINFKNTSEECFLSINQNELKQIFLNLFKNSFDAINEGGEIDIFTETLMEGFQEFSGRTVRIVFKDTGHGIDETEDIFTPFYSTKIGEGNHIGMGLSIVHSIISKYGGKITIQNREKRGVKIVLLFPFETAEE